ncbi:hypothetical protein WALSEDRAFT_30906 [Wallemia mellicola CBS 633.66]|uniref:Uncharacterized protein n=1 Tax=Wallemia mellicola (strain ATCC MYA-4683 / CBS 633.66) TaxID=671144 RepID=I4YJQ3_WALMC|nr:hypothetical protein WALSEDRAFT_30906 [Wallemia mellicola CBS 633.66]EIM24195.1 hypothetical protein WALSEDRAFT_30906 [Wallemia mellicola CBS 633.66]|eukprot:XP_006956014.1 hypothetical protein WALSEDRAFT_30906 [Wallemia mellicola CBS 633.66]
MISQEIENCKTKNWVDFKRYLHGTLLKTCTPAQLTGLLRESQDINSPLSMKYDYLYNELIVYDNDVELLSRNVSRKTWKALIKRRGYGIIAKNLNNIAVNIPLYLLVEFIRSTKQINLIDPDNHNLASDGADNYALLLNTAYKSTGSVDILIRGFDTLQMYRKKAKSIKFRTTSKGMLNLFITISKLWYSNQNDEVMTHILQTLSHNFDFSILSYKSSRQVEIFGAIVKFIKTIPVQARFTYIHTIDRTISDTMTADGQFRSPNPTQYDIPTFEARSLSILYLLPSHISLLLLKNTKSVGYPTEFSPALPFRLNKRLASLSNVGESYVSGLRVAIASRDANRTRLLSSTSDDESDNFTKVTIEGLKSRCKTTTDRDLRKNLVVALLLYSAISKDDLYDNLDWILGRFINDDFTRYEILAATNSYGSTFIECYLYFFEELSGLSVLEGIGQDEVVNKKHVRESVLRAAESGNKLLEKYIDVALHSSAHNSDFSRNEYNELSSLILGVLNKRIETIDRLRILKSTSEDGEEPINQLLDPLKHLFAKWLTQKLTSKESSPIYQKAFPPSMIVQPHAALQPVYSCEKERFNSLSPPISAYGSRISFEFLDSLAQDLLKVRQQHFSENDKPDNSNYYSHIPFIISLPQGISNKNSGKRLRTRFGQFTPYINKITDEDLADIDQGQLRNDWKRLAFGINLWYKMLQSTSKLDRTLVLTNAVKGLAKKMTQEVPTPTDYLYAIIGLAQVDLLSDMAEFVSYLYPCDTKLFFKLLDLDNVLDDSSNFVQRTIDDKYIEFFKKEEWPVTPYQILKKVLEYLNYRPDSHPRVTANRLSRYLSVDFQKKLAKLAVRVLKSNIIKNSDHEEIVVKYVDSSNSWLIGLIFLAASQKGLCASQIGEILSTMKEQGDKVDIFSWMYNVDDLIKAITPVGLQSDDVIIETLVRIVKEPNFIKAQLRLLNGGFLSTMPIEKSKEIAVQLIDLINNKEVHKLTTMKAIISAILVNAQSGFSVKEVSSHLINTAKQVAHPSIQGFIVTQLLRLVPNNVTFEVIDDVLNANFNTIIQNMTLSDDVYAMLRDPNVMFPADHLNSFEKNFYLDDKDKPFIEAVLNRHPRNIPVNLHGRWTKSIETFIVRYLEKRNEFASAIGERFNMFDAARLAHVPNLFTVFAERWYKLCDTKSLLFQSLYLEAVRLPYALKYEESLKTIQEYTIIGKLFKYTNSSDTSGTGLINAFYNIDMNNKIPVESNDGWSTYSWNILNNLSMNIVQFEEEGELLKALHLAQFTKTCFEDIKAGFIHDRVSDIANILKNLKQFCDVGIFTKRLYLNLLVGSGIFFRDLKSYALSGIRFDLL